MMVIMKECEDELVIIQIFTLFPRVSCFPSSTCDDEEVEGRRKGRTQRGRKNDGCVVGMMILRISRLISFSDVSGPSSLIVIIR